jgi:hypothetical protein
MIGLAGLGLSFLTDLIGKYGEPLIAKGIEKVTGIDVTKQELTTEDKQKIIDSQIEIMKIDFEKLKEDNRAKEFITIQDNQNTADARINNTKVQESSNSSWLAKNTPFILDFIIVFAVFILGYSLLFVTIPPDNIQIMNIMFGTLLGILGTVYNYHRGSSNGSAAKSDVINKINKG